MFALITGASKGIGYEMAYLLAEKYDLILVARSKDKLNEMAIDISTKFENRVIVMDYDLTKSEDIDRLFKNTKSFDIEVVINNAGVGRVGMHHEISDEDDWNMIKLNVIAMHRILKEYSSRMVEGYILNVASIASFSAGPKMATYYATKNYILAYSKAVDFENKKMGKKVSSSALCPGPVDTCFNENANVTFKLKGMNARKCAKIALKKMFKRKAIICPSFKVKVASIFMKILPSGFIMRMCYRSQNKKTN